MMQIIVKTPGEKEKCTTTQQVLAVTLVVSILSNNLLCRALWQQTCLEDHHRWWKQDAKFAVEEAAV